jgi:aspartate aminotransferase
MKPISSIAKGIAPSATMAIDSMAKQMKANGIDVISFGAGEPDFNTPDHIKAAGIQAIDNNQTRYTPSTGIVPLREAICRRVLKDTGVHYEPSQICVTSGAKHNVYIALQAIVNAGDEVILPAPYWVTYAEAIRMAGGVPAIIETTEATGFKLTPEMLAGAITTRTKAIILTNPSNPTGMVYSREELEALAKVILENDLYVISDEIYYMLCYEKPFVSIASLSNELYERTIMINGVSKSYAMTGWRIGFAAANAEISKAMSNYLSHSTGSPCSISQQAALAAYAESQEPSFEMKKAFDERRKYFYERVQNIPGVSCLLPEGAFYIFMNIKELFGKTIKGVKINSSADFASAFLEKGLVAVVPGNAFGAEGYVRWSYATSMENIKEGLDRLERFLAED